MSELTTPLRNQLGKTIVEARRVAEAGAKKALESLAVERHEPHGSMSLGERALRNRLRARGRQLGDVRDRQRGHQSIGRLTHEVAYEHWHRMLFARFLADNGLLVHPDHQVPMTLEEVEELAQEIGEDPHQMAARFAQNSLPQIFRSGDPVLEVSLAPESRQKLESLLDSLPSEVFTADDSLGWTYQYWQSERKDTVNASEEKIGADELPAVTQLFTEHYMVEFLYHNTIGAWHAGNVMAANPTLAETANSEDELRSAVSFDSAAGKSTFNYLRFVRQQHEDDEDENPTGPWRPAAGTFGGWPKAASDLRVLDPCCGSGHFLVVGFKQLVRLRMHEENLSTEDAIAAVLRDNIYGLELDLRCTQIAAFNLAVAAWKLAGKRIDLPPLNIACSGLSIGSSKKDWLTLAGDDDHLRNGLENLYDLFRKAPEFGSLIDPKTLGDDLFEADIIELQPALQKALAYESDSAEKIERAVAAQGIARAAEMLSGEYTLIITNPPYLARGKQTASLGNWVDSQFPMSKPDLATVFLERWLRSTAVGGTTAVVTPQNWFFLPSYKAFRQLLLRNQNWNLVARLGPNAFRGMNFWAATTALSVLSRKHASDTEMMTILDVSSDKSQEKKAAMLSGRLPAPKIVANQSAQLSNPDSRISLRPIDPHTLLSRCATSPQGIKTGDDARFRRNVWELSPGNGRWRVLQGSTSETKLISGLDTMIDWSTEGRYFARLQGQKGWGHNGVVLKLMGDVQTSLHIGEIFDSNVTVLIPKEAQWLPSILAFCASKEYSDSLHEAEQAAKINNATAVKVPFDLEYWRKIAAQKYPNGLPEPQSDDPTQWLFHGHPAKADPATILQVAAGRLLGYRWSPELDPKIQLADEAREWVARCNELQDFTDDDGIVCLPAIRSELPAVDRLHQMLSAAFGSEWSAAKERELLAAAAGEGNKPIASLDVWLRDKFFEEHCKLFNHRPFIWHIWDGNRDGFHCLVNAHSLTGPDGEGRRTLEAIAYSYLGDWIQRQKNDQKTMVEGADARLAAALELQKQLEKILEGEPPYDLFVRWKPLHEQAIGWDPNPNDGVRLNIRPFMNAELRKGGKRGAGILRWKPNIKWKKDRGKEPDNLRPKEDFPWFWGYDDDGNASGVTDYTAERPGKANFDGNRWNDLHYSRTVKEAARVAAKARPEEHDE